MAEGKQALDQGRLLESAKDRVAAVQDLATAFKTLPVAVGAKTAFPLVPGDLVKRCGSNVPGLILELETMARKDAPEEVVEQIKGLVEGLSTAWSGLTETFWPMLKNNFNEEIKPWIANLWKKDDDKAPSLYPDLIEEQTWEGNFAMLGGLFFLVSCFVSGLKDCWIGQLVE